MKSKSKSLLLILLVYIAAFSVGGVFLAFMREYLSAPLCLFLTTVIATVVVFGFSLIVGNASVYDPYWSVQPPFLILGFHLAYNVAFDARLLILYIPVMFWAVRLTANWAIGFDNLEWQDWRYTDLKNRYPRIAQLIMFTGIMMMPTCLVYMGTLPVWYLMTAETPSLALLIVGGLLVIGGTLLELFADMQMKRYKQDPAKKAYIDTGLWKYSRHPNYLGEILIWVGIFVASLGSFAWLALPGVILMVLLFLFISIPMMEKHMLAKRPEYAEYQKSVSMLIPLPPRKVAAAVDAPADVETPAAE